MLFLNFIPAHKKDRNFLDNLMNVVSWLFAKNNLNSTISLSDIHLVTAMGVYGRKILRSMNATFTNPFEVVSENVIFGLDEVGAKGKEKQQNYFEFWLWDDFISHWFIKKLE